MMEENKGTYAYPNGIYYIFVFILKIDNERAIKPSHCLL